MFLFVKEDYSTAGVIAIGVLGLVSIAIWGKKLVTYFEPPNPVQQQIYPARCIND